MIQKFWKSMAFMGIMFVLLAAGTSIIQWAIAYF